MSDPVLTDLARRLREARLALSKRDGHVYTHAEIASMAGVDVASLRMLEIGAGRPDMSVLDALAGIYETTVDVLLEGPRVATQTSPKARPAASSPAASKSPPPRRKTGRRPTMSPEEMQVFARNLKQFRDEYSREVGHSVRVEELAQLADMSLWMIRRYEAGTSGASADYLKKLGDVFGRPVEHFTMDPPPPPPVRAVSPVRFMVDVPDLSPRHRQILDDAVAMISSEREQALRDAKAAAKTAHKAPRGRPRKK